MQIRSYSLLERTSGFILVILPYLLTALIAAVVVPGFLYSQTHDAKATAAPNGHRFEVIHWDHAMLSSDSVKAAGVKLAYRQG
jgi:hypothetical protein